MDRRRHLVAPLLLLVACDADDAPPPAAAPAPRGAAMGHTLDLSEEPGDLALPAVVCADGPTVKGVDVSAWQATINWASVAADGQKFAFIRVSDGTQYIDDYFPANWQQAQQNGLIVGAYQYFRPAQDPIAQANLLLQKMGPLGPGILPPVIDVETNDGLAPNQVANKVGQWIDHVEAALGVKPIVYTGKYVWQSQVGSAEWSTYPLWIAQYGPVCPDLPDPWSDWVFFQTSSSGKVPGINGNVDMDLFNGSLADLEAMANTGGPVQCGDAKCSGGEDSDTCPADCKPCGTIPPDGGIIDDPDACFHRFGNQQYWYEADLGWQDHLWWTHAVEAPAPDDHVIWELHFAEAGTYRAEVYIAGPQASAEKTVYDVTHAGGEDSIPLDQSAHDGWAELGEFTFQAGGHGQQVRLVDNTGEPFSQKHQIVFDALRLTRTDAPATTGDTSSSGGTTGDTSATTDASASATDASASATTSATSETSDTSATSDTDAGSASATGASATGVDQDPADQGCGCRSAASPPLWALLPLAARRRRRRAA